MPISNLEISEWKTNEVTKAYKQAIDIRISELLQQALTWDVDSLKYNQGYLRALVDIDPKEFTVEGF